MPPSELDQGLIGNVPQPLPQVVTIDPEFEKMIDGYPPFGPHADFREKLKTALKLKKISVTHLSMFVYMRTSDFYRLFAESHPNTLWTLGEQSLITGAISEWRKTLFESGDGIFITDDGKKTATVSAEKENIRPLPSDRKYVCTTAQHAAAYEKFKIASGGVGRFDGDGEFPCAACFEVIKFTHETQIFEFCKPDYFATVAEFDSSTGSKEKRHKSWPISSIEEFLRRSELFFIALSLAIPELSFEYGSFVVFKRRVEDFDLNTPLLTLQEKRVFLDEFRRSWSMRAINRDGSRTLSFIDRISKMADFDSFEKKGISENQRKALISQSSYRRFDRNYSPPPRHHPGNVHQQPIDGGAQVDPRTSQNPQPKKRQRKQKENSFTFKPNPFKLRTDLICPHRICYDAECRNVHSPGQKVAPIQNLR